MMDERNKAEHQQFSDHNHQELDVNTMLETRIAHALRDQATQVHFTAAQRERVMRRIAVRPKQTRLSAQALVFAASLAVILSFAVYLFASAPSHPTTTARACTHRSIYGYLGSRSTSGKLVSHVESRDRLRNSREWYNTVVANHTDQRS